jgi:hypothetical protein
MLQLEEKVQNMDLGVQIFFSKIEALQKNSLPGLKVINDKLMRDWPIWLRTVQSLQEFKRASLARHS